MASTAKLVAEHLATALSTTVRAGAMPTDPKIVGAVIDLPGDGSRPRICAGPAALHRVRFAVDFRDLEANYEAAVTRCHAAVAALEPLSAIGGVAIWNVLMTTAPHPIERGGGLVRVRTQFSAERMAG